MNMKKRGVLSMLAALGTACFALAATVGAAAPCFAYFYQPKTPANVKARLAKSGD